MYKITVLIALILSGCANFTINGTMCDQVAREPGATVPQECRDYNEKEADKAFHKVVEEKKVSDKDIKFDKEEN
ncbi:hypothetical protein JHD49_04500 [Sulfurimonas sp. SAG-AH-194-C21]|nr:hypothetical protein [Sulfurimonas sp. SAG-AH-194-C21]MDF1883192.1 hypothetical protein [Sulfurimonas sp. SAG-AH-194-C21]